MQRFIANIFSKLFLIVRRFANSIYTKLILWIYWKFRSNQIGTNGIIGLIGNTPMVELTSLSQITGCRILAKLEYQNPSGSPKDRITLHFFNKLVNQGVLSPIGSPFSEFKKNSMVELVEGSTGSTGISLSCIARKFNAKCTIFMPSDQSIEKTKWMRLFGAQVIVTPPASFVNPEHYSKQAENYSRQQSATKRIFFDQFENVENNVLAHYETTGPEIWTQTSGSLSAIVLAAGTGGTLTGVSRYLKEKNPEIKVYLADPQGSGLHSYIDNGVLFSSEEREGTRTRHQVDSIVQGVGLNRLTRIIKKTPELVDGSFKIEDSEVIEMASLFVGSSSALNLAAVIKAAKKLPKGSTIVTILSDAGYRHWSTLWNDRINTV